MLSEGFEFLVTLGERIGLLARGRARLHRGLNTKRTEQFSKLLVAHEFSLVHTRGCQQVFLHLLDADEVLLQHVAVEFQHRVDEHAQGLVDHTQLLLGKILYQDGK